MRLSHVVLYQELCCSCGVRYKETIDAILRQSGRTYFRVNVRPEIVFFSLGASDDRVARFSTWSQPLTLRRMRMCRFVFAALMW